MGDLSFHISSITFNVFNLLFQYMTFHYLYFGYPRCNPITTQKIFLMNLCIGEGFRNFFDLLIVTGSFIVPLLPNIEGRNNLTEVQAYFKIFHEVTIVLNIYVNMFFIAIEFIKEMLNEQKDVKIDSTLRNKNVVRRIVSSWLLGTWIGFSLCIACAVSYVDRLHSVEPNLTYIRACFDIIFLSTMLAIYVALIYKLIQNGGCLRRIEITGGCDKSENMYLNWYRYSINIFLLQLTTFLFLAVLPHLTLFFRYVTHSNVTASVSTAALSFCISDMCHAFIYLLAVCVRGGKRKQCMVFKKADMNKREKCVEIIQQGKLSWHSVLK